MKHLNTYRLFESTDRIAELKAHRAWLLKEIGPTGETFTDMFTIYITKK
jgi:hypothetical protein